MPRFVILTHDWPFPHFDFMLECGESLRTWRLPALPDSLQSVLAEPLGNHRLAYLDYEGPVSNDRGEVSRWDAGTFEWQIESAELVVVQISGKRINGTIELRMQDDHKWKCWLRI